MEQSGTTGPAQDAPATAEATADPGSAPQDADASFGRFNLAVLGAPQVGKSTLVEAAFGIRYADNPPGRTEVWSGRFERIEHPDGFLTCCESRTFTADKDPRPTVDALINAARDVESAPLNDQIHAVWWVTESGARPDAAHLAGIAALAEALPVMVVMTRVPASMAGRPTQSAVQSARWIESRLLPLSPSNRVYLVNALAQPKSGTPVHGIAELREATFACSPEAARRARAAAEVHQRIRRRSPEWVAGVLTDTVRARLAQLEAESRPYRSVIRAGWDRLRRP